MDHNLIFYQKDDGGFSWPRRNFRCNFCNKEYKCAQALGGHMNVHRKERAKLGLSSPSSRHANPNPNHISPVPSPLRYLPYNNTTYHSSLFPPVSNAKDDHQKNGEGGGGNDIRVWKKYEIFNMEMEIESLKHGSIELDLELRLGPS